MNYSIGEMSKERWKTKEMITHTYLIPDKIIGRNLIQLK
jgi:hypothetical protein